MNTKEKIEVMQAYVDGKQIQIRFSGDDKWNDWESYDEPQWQWDHNFYRIKPEQKYVPYENTSEMIDDYCERFNVVLFEMPIIWVVVSDEKRMIVSFGDESIHITNGLGGVYEWTMDELFKFCTYFDKSPIGKLVKE